jgi:Tfp pilus assembly protein PilF
VRAHFNLGIVFLALGRGRQATGEFREAVRHDPEHAASLFSLGILLLQRGDNVAAAEAFRGAAQARPGYARAHNSLGVALFRMSRTAEAAEEFREATRIFPSYVGAHFNLGLCLLRPEDRDGASRQLTVLSFLDPPLSQRYAALLSRRRRTEPSLPFARPLPGPRATYPPM